MDSWSYERGERCKLAHDLKNHLTVILGAVELLQEEPQVGPECAKRLKQIGEAARRMAEDLRRRPCQFDPNLRKPVTSALPPAWGNPVMSPPLAGESACPGLPNPAVQNAAK